MEKKKLIYLSFITFCYYIVVGVALSIFSILLDKQNVSTTLIGLSDSVRRLSGFVFVSLLPIIVHKIGIIKTISSTILTYSIILLILPFVKNYYLWLGLIVFFGMSMMSTMTLIDSITNSAVDNSERGKTNGFINTIILIAIAIAPFITNIIENNKLLYVIILSIFLLNMLAIYFCKNFKEYNQIQFIKHLNLIDFFKKTPDIFISKIFLEFFSNSLFIFTIVYLNNNGYSYAIGGKCLSIYCFAGLIASYFTGVLIQKSKNANLLLKESTLFTILLCFSIRYAIASEYALYIVYGLLGISTGFIILGTLISLDSHYEKEKLVSANAVLTLFGSIAMVFSGIITGYFINKYNSMILASCFIGFIYIVQLIYAEIKKN